MLIGSKELKVLKERHGDAFYLLDSENFKNNFLELKKEFSEIYSNFNIAYSYKTNYIPKLCKIVDQLGGYSEVVSEMELELALRIGVKPNRIIWNGPIKELNTLEDFLIHGGICNIDSIEEMNQIKEMKNNHKDISFNIGIRCNFDVRDGVISRFGFDVDGSDFNEIITFVNKTAGIEFANLQCHFAKRQLEYWSHRVTGMINLIDKIGVIPKRIDLGGGIYGRMDDELKKQFKSEIPCYKDYAIEVASIFKTKFKNENFKPELIIEPGSALVGDCMQFAAEIKTIKQIRGKIFASVLASQKNISMAGVNPPMRIIKMGSEQQKYENVDFVGYTCIESDVLYRDYSGYLERGDMVLISNCGSYSIVMKPPFILPNFPVIDISTKDMDIIKKKETFDDIFHTYVF